MPLDGISSSFLRDELANALLGSRLQDIYQSARQAIFLKLRQPGKTYGLHISVDPSAAALYLLNTSPHRLEKQANFVTSLRRRILAAELREIYQAKTERIFRFVFRSKNEIGDFEDYILVVELMGKHSNLILLRSDELIHDAFRHIDHSVNRHREIMPARPYIDPPAQNKLDYTNFLDNLPAYLSGEEILPFLCDEQILAESGRKTLAKFLLSNLAGFSPLLCSEVVFRSKLAEHLRANELSPLEQKALSKSIASVFKDIACRNLAPANYYLEKNVKEAQDFHALPLQLYPHKKSFGSLSESMAFYYGQKDREEHFQQLKQKVEKRLKNLSQNNLRRYELHLKDKTEGERADEYKLYADLLQAKIYQIDKQASSVIVENYYDPELKPVEIALDPSLSAAANVERYYKRYHKAKAKLQHALKYLREDELESQWLNNLETLVAVSEDVEDLQAVREEIDAYQEDNSAKRVDVQEKIPKGQILNPGKPGRKDKYRPSKQKTKKHKKQAKAQAPAAGFREFRSSDGFLIRVGRNNIANDRLTFKKARKDDLWFHAQGRPGSHTVLHLEGKDATNVAIEEAAGIAAYYSSANKTSAGARLTVDYCPIKNVTRIPGAKPGLVNYRDFQSAYVEAKLPD